MFFPNPNQVVLVPKPKNLFYKIICMSRIITTTY